MNSSTRRQFLGTSLGLCSLAITPSAWATPAPAKSRGLSFLSLHTGESLKTGITPDSPADAETIQAVNYLLRDHRSGDVHDMDPALLVLLAKLQQEVNVAGPYHIISAYRSPRTNDKLRAAGRGVAKKSLHMQGRAIDIRLPGCELKTLRDAAISLGGGGVGYYAKSDFIHVDTGRVRRW